MARREMKLASPVEKRLLATAVGVAIFLVALGLRWSGLLTVAELKTLDLRYQRYANPARASKDLVLVAIDEASLATFGRWPWPRDRHGYVVRYLKEAGAKAIVFDVLFLEPDEQAEEFDAVLAEEMRAAGNVFLPFLLLDPGADHPREAATPAPSPLPEVMARATIPMPGQPAQHGSAFRLHHGVKLPIPALAEAAQGLGFITMFPDSDGTTRRLPLLAPAYGAAFLQLAAAVARDIRGADGAVLEPGALQLGSLTIPLTVSGDMVIDWHGTLEQQTYPAYSIGAVLQSFLDMQEGRQPLLDPALFSDKIVFIAATAAGTYDLRVTPLAPLTPGVLVHMAALDNMLQGRFIRPASSWVCALTTLVLCLSTSWSFMLLQRQTLKLGLIGGIAVGYGGLAVYAFTTHGLWLELAAPEGALAMTFTVAATAAYLTEGKQRRQLRAVFDKYMAAEVVDEILRHPAGIKLGGETQELSVFFLDVAGFTSIAEHLEPEALVELVNTCLSAMTDGILQHRGNVNKYLGDGIMALFGAPRGEPNHATLACYAALACQRALTQRRAAWRARGYAEINVRIGIHSGPVVVGNMGSPARMEYTVIGDGVNLASRLEGANKFYGTRILLGPRTFERAQGDIEAREVDVIRVQGKREPVVIYELLARKGELSDGKRRVVEAFLAGLAAYKQRDFCSAKLQFEAALRLDPTDGPAQVYVRRVQEYLRSPPPADWDGVYALTAK